MVNKDQISIDNSVQETGAPQEQAKPENSPESSESLESIAENRIAKVDSTSQEIINAGEQRLERAKTYYELPKEKTEEVLASGGFKEQLDANAESITSLADSTKEKITIVIGKKETPPRFAWHAEQNSRMEGKEDVETELETLRVQIDAYNNDSFLNKIKDYFAYRNTKAQLTEKSGELATAQGSIDQRESEKPEFQEVKTLLKKFYDGEKEKWAKANYTPEDLKQQFTEEHLANLSVDDYATLMRRFPGEMLTHVTRQGIRDHAGSIWHTAGVGAFQNGFKEMLADGKLRSSLGIALQEHSKEEAMAKFLHLDNLDDLLSGEKDINRRDKALMMFRDKFEYNKASSDAFADSAAVHLASEIVMDGMYGSERRNEIFIAYPSAYIASQLNYGGKGTLADRNSSEQVEQHNDKWVYTKDHEGVSLDAALIFIPEDAKVDPQTGSRYKMGVNGELIVPKQRTNEVLAARFEKSGFVQTFVQDLPHRMNQAPEQGREALAEAAFGEFGITDPEAKKALLDSRLVDKLASAWGQEGEKEEYEKLFTEYFPDQRPSKVVYYSGGDPSRALNEWREKNGIVKKTEDSEYGFAEHHIKDSSAEANIGKDRFSSLARKVIDDRFPDTLQLRDSQREEELSI